MWIHCRSPVASAKASMRAWVTSTQALTPSSIPTAAAISAALANTRISASGPFGPHSTGAAVSRKCPLTVGQREETLPGNASPGPSRPEIAGSGEETMTTLRTALLGAAFALAAVPAALPAAAQHTLKIGYIDPLSGAFANVGELRVHH